MQCPLLSLFTGCALLAALASGCAESAESTATATSVAAKLSVCMGAEIEETWVGVLAVAISYPDTVYASIRQSDLSCVSEAANCFAVFECLGHDTDQACRGSSFGSTCIDETAQMCTTVNSAGYGWVLEDDCTAGLSAEMGNDECMIGEWDWSEASCYAGTCEDATSWCVGTEMRVCHEKSLLSGEGMLETVDCAKLGQVCEEASFLGAHCVTIEGEACSETRCDGNVVKSCGQEGVVETRFDCSDLGPSYRCVQSASNNAECRSVEVLTCVDGDAICVGSSAHFCVGGAWQVLDCGGFMGATCDKSGGSLRCRSESWDDTLSRVRTSNPSGSVDNTTSDTTSEVVGNTKDACEAAMWAYKECTSFDLFDCEDTFESETMTVYYNCLMVYYSTADCSSLPEFPEFCSPEEP